MFAALQFHRSIRRQWDAAIGLVQAELCRIKSEFGEKQARRNLRRRWHAPLRVDPYNQAVLYSHMPRESVSKCLPQREIKIDDWFAPASVTSEAEKIEWLRWSWRQEWFI